MMLANFCILQRSSIPRLNQFDGRMRLNTQVKRHHHDSVSSLHAYSHWQFGIPPHPVHPTKIENIPTIQQYPCPEGCGQALCACCPASYCSAYASPPNTPCCPARKPPPGGEIVCVIGPWNTEDRSSPLRIPAPLQNDCTAGVAPSQSPTATGTGTGTGHLSPSLSYTNGTCRGLLASLPDCSRNRGTPGVCPPGRDSAEIRLAIRGAKICGLGGSGCRCIHGDGYVKLGEDLRERRSASEIPVAMLSRMMSGPGR